MSEYTLTIKLSSDSRLPTWDVGVETPNEVTANLLMCCLNQTVDAQINSFTMVRDGQSIPDQVLENCIETWRWPPPIKGN